MGIVYLARDRATGLSVAIKLLGTLHAGNAEAAARFAREARTVAALDHPHIVRTLAIEELSGRSTAIVSEYVPGKSLRAVLRELGPLSFDDAASVLRDVASALAYAHGYRIVHRDVKPENIVIEESTGHALLADFGIARPLDSDTLLTMAGSSLGTPSYMAPEMVQGGKVDVTADVYALGLVGWEMLTGARPWEGETLYEVLHKQQHEALPSLAALRPEIPAYLLLAIEGAIAKRPRDRWADGGEFLARLNPTPGALPARRNAGDAWVDADTVPLESPVTRAEPPVTPLQPLAIDIERRSAPLEHPATNHVERAPSLEPLQIAIAQKAEARDAQSTPATGNVAPAPAEGVAVDAAVVDAAAVDGAFAHGAVHHGAVDHAAVDHGAVADRGVDRAAATPVARRRRPMTLAGPLLALVATVVIALMVLNGKRSTLTGDVAIGFPQTNVDTARRDEPIRRDSASGQLPPTPAPNSSSVRTAPPVARNDSVARPRARSQVSSRADSRADTAARTPPARTSPQRRSPPSTSPPSTSPPNTPPPRTSPPRTSSTAPAGTATTAASADARCNSPANGDQRACLNAGIDRNDAELTRTYHALIARLRREAGGVREPPTVQRLRAEQRAWIDRRDRACRGALWGAERLPCFARESDAREAVLRKRLEDGAQQN